MLSHASYTVYYDELLDIYSTINFADKSLKTIDIWISLVENHAKRLIADIKDSDEAQRLSNTFKGDMLEIFAEIFFKSDTFNPEFALSDYEVADKDNDMGVDATGFNVNGHKSAVQCKYKLNPYPKGDEQITYGDLAKTYSDGHKNHNCDLSQPSTMFLFTTANDYSFEIDKEYKKQLVFIGRKQLEAYVNQNINFWKVAYSKVLIE